MQDRDPTIFLANRRSNLIQNLLMVHKTLLSGQPKYLHDMLKPVTNSNIRNGMFIFS